MSSCPSTPFLTFNVMIANDRCSLTVYRYKVRQLKIKRSPSTSYSLVTHNLLSQKQSAYLSERLHNSLSWYLWGLWTVKIWWPLLKLGGPGWQGHYFTFLKLSNNIYKSITNAFFLVISPNATLWAVIYWPMQVIMKRSIWLETLLGQKFTGGQKSWWNYSSDPFLIGVTDLMKWCPWFNILHLQVQSRQFLHRAVLSCPVFLYKSNKTNMYMWWQNLKF